MSYNYKLHKVLLESSEDLKKRLNDMPCRQHGETNMKDLNLPKRKSTSKRITINGQTYDSLRDAAKLLDTSSTVINALHRDASRSGLSEIERQVRVMITLTVSIPKENDSE